MSAVPKRKLTPAEYLAIELSVEERNELLDGMMRPRERSSRWHNTISTNLTGEIGGRLKGEACYSLSLTQRIHVERTDAFFYPDFLIVCGNVHVSPNDPDTITNPRVVIEVLSDSTERYDRTTKFRHYQQLPSVQEYILVSQDEAVCERFVRQADGSWALVSFVGLAAELAFTAVPVRVPLADIYAGVEFPAPPPRGT